MFSVIHTSTWMDQKNIFFNTIENSLAYSIYEIKDTTDLNTHIRGIIRVMPKFSKYF